MSGLEVQGEPRCDEAGCCVFRAEGAEELMLLHNTLFLDQICTVDGALRSISFLDGN